MPFCIHNICIYVYSVIRRVRSKACKPVAIEQLNMQCIDIQWCIALVLENDSSIRGHDPTTQPSTQSMHLCWLCCRPTCSISRWWLLIEPDSESSLQWQGILIPLITLMRESSFVAGTPKICQRTNMTGTTAKAYLFDLLLEPLPGCSSLSTYPKEQINQFLKMPVLKAQYRLEHFQWTQFPRAWTSIRRKAGFFIAARNTPSSHPPAMTFECHMTLALRRASRDGWLSVLKN